jgi:hypothetical protein
MKKVVTNLFTAAYLINNKANRNVHDWQPLRENSVSYTF